ncbi:MAG: hypothetical protein U0704_12675 [Candidatus Eisenbacteria bacterium]
MTLHTIARRTFVPALAAWALTVAVTDASARREIPAAAARAALEPAVAAARSWAADAELVYLENDEPLGATGAAPRWSFLWYSPALEASRVYSVRDGRVVVAEKFELKFAAPPLGESWLDSDAALAVADERARSLLRDAPGLHVAHMLLGRGAFQPGQADLTTWTIVYEAEGEPSLFVVVDAASGRVCRTWRG